MNKSNETNMLNMLKLIHEVITSITPYEFNGRHPYTDRYESTDEGLSVLMDECLCLINQIDPEHKEAPLQITKTNTKTRDGKEMFFEPIGIFYKECCGKYIAYNHECGLQTKPKNTKWEAFLSIQKIVDLNFTMYGVPYRQ